MTSIEEIPKTYDQAVRVLAHWHGEGGATDLRVFAFRDPDQKIVRLLHVSATFPDSGGVQVYKLGRSDEFPFKSAVALALPKYWDSIKTGANLLPPDWDPNAAERVWPDDRA